MKFRPSSNQCVPNSCQLRVGQYARTISHDSPAPHSYYPTMGRRQRRQPINPPRCSSVTAFQTKATSFASSSSCLKTRHVVDVFSEADFGPTTRTSIFSRDLAAFCKKSTAPRVLTTRQTAANSGKRRRLYYRPPSKYNKTRLIVNLTPKKLEKFEVFKKELPEKRTLKVSLKLKTYF